MKLCLYLLLMLYAINGNVAQRKYPCGDRPCPPDFDPVCGWKSLIEDGKNRTIDKMFPNVCKMAEENDCDHNNDHWTLHDICPPELVKDEEAVRIKYQKEIEEDEKDFSAYLKDLVES